MSRWKPNHDSSPVSDDCSGAAAALDSIQAESQTLFCALGVFQERACIPRHVILKLWKQLRPALDDQAMVRLVEQLAALGLIRLDAETDRVALAGSLVRVAAARLGDRAAQTHAALLDTYNPHSFRWHEIHDDGYLYDYLADHLCGARRDDALDDLFSDDLWMRARFAQCGYNYTGFLHDLAVAWERAALPTTRTCAVSFVRCVRYALIRSAVNSLAISYVPELALRAVESGQPGWPPQRAVALAGRLGEARFDAAGRAPSPDGQDLQSDRLSQGGAALAIKYPTPDALLAELAPVFACTQPDEMTFNTALDEVRAPDLTGDARTRAVARALKAASAIGAPRSRACALTLLAPLLSEELIPRALDATLAIRSTYYRARALRALARLLSGKALLRALDSSPSIDGPTAIQHVIALISQTVTLLTRSALAVWRRLLGQIQAAYNPDYARRTLDRLPGVKYDEQRAKALAALAPCLREEEAVRRALDLALAMRWEDDRACALAGLAPVLPADLFARALDAVMSIRYPLTRAEALVAFLPAAAGQKSIIIGHIREAVGAHLLNMKEANFTEVVWFCFNERLFDSQTLSVRDLLGIHAWIGRLCRDWRWQ